MQNCVNVVVDIEPLSGLAQGHHRPIDQKLKCRSQRLTKVEEWRKRNGTLGKETLGGGQANATVHGKHGLSSSRGRDPS